MELTVNQRIKILIDTLENGVSSRFAKNIGVSPSVVAGYLPGSREGEPSFSVLQKIIYAYPNIDLEWLVFGKGEMLKGGAVNQNKSLQILPITVDELGDENIVMVDTKAQGGYPTHYLEPEYYKQLPTIKFPSARFRNGTFRAFEVTGESMSPTLHPGAVVFGRYEDNWEKGNIQEGYIYVVVTHEVVVVKRVLNRVDRGELYLMSDNEGYEGFPVNIEDVRQLWRVVGGMVFKFPNTRYEWRRKMSHMEADIYELRQQITDLQKLIS